MHTDPTFPCPLVSKAIPRLSAEAVLYQYKAGLYLLQVFSDKHESMLVLTSDLPIIALYVLYYGDLMTSIYQNIAENSCSSLCASG